MAVNQAVGGGRSREWIRISKSREEIDWKINFLYLCI